MITFKKITVKGKNKPQKKDRSVIQLNVPNGVPEFKVPFPRGHKEGTIRPSHLKAFSGCGLKYKINYLLGVQRPKEALFNGSIFDEACNAVAKIIRDNDDKTVMGKYGTQGLIKIAIEAAKTSYDNQINYYMDKDGVPRWMKPFANYTKLIQSSVFIDFIGYLRKTGVKSVQETVSFEWVYPPTGEVLVVEGVLDIVTDHIIDVKTASQNPVQRKKDEDGEYIKDEDGNEKRYVKISPEYEIQTACYLRAKNQSYMELFYFIKTKEPKFEVVRVHNTQEMQNLLDVYLTSYYEAHMNDRFLPNTFYEWCNICEFRGNLCTYTKHRGVE